MKLNKENGMKLVFFLAALTSVLAVALICIFLFAGGLPAMAKIGFGDFIFGRKWKPGNNIFGIFPMIMGSICVTGVSLAIGVPVGLFTSVFMAAYCPKKIYRVCQSAINLMAGIPSIVYGFFGLVLIVPLMNTLTGKDGSTMLTASIVLAIMILPTIIAQAETSLRSVPDSYYEGSLALGATKERSLFFVVLPAAKSGDVYKRQDLHHAKDAYLNIVVGNTYYVKFTKNAVWFVKENPGRTYNLEKMFTGKYDVERNGEIAWETGGQGTRCV